MTGIRELSQWRSLTRDGDSRARYQRMLQRADRDIASMLEIDVEKGFSSVLGQNSPHLQGIPFSVKDNIALSGFSFTCGSKILEPLVSPYHAGAVQKLLSAGAVPVGKANMDEFGMGSSTENSAFTVTRNPWDLDRVPGGSSGGSAASVAAGLVPFSLGSDTGGSVRQPAAFCGIYGCKPTYGRVSRYGLAAYASSLETIGILSADISMMEQVFHCISGTDERDQTTWEAVPASQDEQVSPTAAVISDLEGMDPEIRRGYERTLEAMKSLGWKITEVSLKSLKYAMPAFYTIACAEASSNLARYTGIRYGMRHSTSAAQEEMVRMTREEGFSAEVKLRVLLGTYVLRSGFQDQYYLKAQKIRTRMKQEFDMMFSQADVLLMPVYPVQAFKAGDEGMTPMQQKVADRYTLPANLAGLPAVSFPAGIESGLPVGMQLLGPSCSEERLFSLIRKLSEVIPPPELPVRLGAEEEADD